MFRRAVRILRLDHCLLTACCGSGLAAWLCSVLHPKGATQNTIKRRWISPLDLTVPPPVSLPTLPLSALTLTYTTSERSCCLYLRLSIVVLYARCGRQPTVEESARRIAKGLIFGLGQDKN